MSMQIVSNGRRRRVRVGQLIAPPPRRSPAALRRQQLSDAKKDAKERLSNLDVLISKLAKQLARASGRYGYVPVLARIYERICEWKEKGILERRKADIAALRGVALRKDAKTITVFVTAVCERASWNMKTASRWAGKLNDALEGAVQPGDIEDHLKGIN